MAGCGGDRYLLAQTRDRMDFPATLLAIRQMCETWPQVSPKLVEENANGPAVVQSLRHAVAGFVEVNPEGGKISRAVAASAQLESGHWYLPHPKLAPWVDGFITECAAFPGSLNDDQVDAWSQGAHRLMAVVGKRPQQAPRNWPERERSQRPER
jgi:predicted phage terminase large subunit-like protein